ncbi:MAG: hypothetical protein WCF28_06220 [Methanobacterium sp.]|uniref:hypothetical protein n=1 Tax=Methanobacterium sp. TaxID=2164 RepID=UPI003C7280E9
MLNVTYVLKVGIKCQRMDTFTAWEEPELLAKDMREFFQRFINKQSMFTII